MKTYWIVLPDCTSFKKHRAFFIKGDPNPGPQDIGCPRLEHLLNLTLCYGFSLWYDVIFVDNINVLDLALLAELKLNVFLCNFKQELSYRKQIARKLRTQFVEGIYRSDYA